MNVRTWKNEFLFMNTLSRKELGIPFENLVKVHKYIHAHNSTQYFRDYAECLELQFPPTGNETKN